MYYNDKIINILIRGNLSTEDILRENGNYF